MSYVSSQLAMIPSSRSILCRDKRLPLDTWNTSWLQENVFGNQFSTFDSTRDHPEGIHPCAPQREQGSVPQATGTVTLFADICRKAVDYEFVNTGGFSAEFYGWRGQTANTGTAIRQILTSIIFGLEDTIQKASDHLFWFSVGSNVMDQRSGDGWFIGRIEVLAIRFWKEFSKLRDAGREDCLCSEQDHPEFPV